MFLKYEYKIRIVRTKTKTWKSSKPTNYILLHSRLSLKIVASVLPFIEDSAPQDLEMMSCKVTEQDDRSQRSDY